jgi:sigma-B regulation protein RsbU (phosphoserine phosphatase)
MIGKARGERFQAALEEANLELRAGQSFVLYTDGLVEAHERGGDEFGIDRVIEHLDREAGAGGGRPLAEALDGLVREVASWTGGAAQEDDISVLAVRRNA